MADMEEKPAVLLRFLEHDDLKVGGQSEEKQQYGETTNSHKQSGLKNFDSYSFCLLIDTKNYRDNNEYYSYESTVVQKESVILTALSLL